MAPQPDAKPAPEKDEITELIWILLAVFLFFWFLNLLGGVIGSSKLFSLGWKAFTPQGILISKTRPISSLINPINSRFVVVSKEAPLLSSPGGKEITKKKMGDKGIIAGGPVTIGSDKYWRVNFEDGSSGWMNEKDIANLPQAVTPMKDVPTLINSQVETNKDTPVLSEPGGAEIATKNAGLGGTILEGPIIKDKKKYWHIRFDDGVEGWVLEENLNSLKIERQQMSEALDQIGGRVAVSKGPLDVLDSPGGKKIGIELIGVKGRVIAGPSEFEGVKYWKVKFDDGVEGWAREDSLDYLRISKVPLSEMPSFIGGKVSTNRNATQVFDQLGGKVIATKSKNTGGSIIDGPLVLGNKNYWHIKFDDGTEGWVSEDDLNYIENTEPNPIVKFVSFLVSSIGLLKYVLVLFSLVLAGCVYYLYKNLSALRTKERVVLYPTGILDNVEEKKLVNPSWERVLDYIDSFNESDWKLAIIESDIMLGELLDKLSLPGETIGEKLKLIEKSDFTTIENAWDAHKVRNQISHEGDFKLTQREARRVIDLYRSIFDEFEII